MRFTHFDNEDTTHTHKPQIYRRMEQKVGDCSLNDSNDCYDLSKKRIKIGYTVKLDELDVNYDFEDSMPESKGESHARRNADYGVVASFIESGNNVLLRLEDGRVVLPYTVEIVENL